MDDPLQIDTVNPYDPPEKQALEQQLENDTRLEQETHRTIEQERHLADSAQQAGYPHTHTDARLQDLEHSEQVMAGNVVRDQQAIEHWDHDHPDGGQAGATSAADSTAAGSYADSSYDASSDGDASAGYSSGDGSDMTGDA